MRQSRGLCFACYHDRAVRGLYRAAGNHLRTGISDDEIAALPAQPFGDEEPEPPPYTPPADEKAIGDWCEQWANVGANGLYDMHPDTAPEAIRATQRGVVAEARQRLGPHATPEEIGADVCLPTWSVRERIKELDTARG